MNLPSLHLNMLKSGRSSSLADKRLGGAVGGGVRGATEGAEGEEGARTEDAGPA